MVCYSLPKLSKAGKTAELKRIGALDADERNAEKAVDEAQTKTSELEVGREVVGRVVGEGDEDGGASWEAAGGNHGRRGSYEDDTTSAPIIANHGRRGSYEDDTTSVDERRNGMDEAEMDAARTDEIMEQEVGPGSLEQEAFALKPHERYEAFL